MAYMPARGADRPVSAHNLRASQGGHGCGVSAVLNIAPQGTLAALRIAKRALFFNLLSVFII